MAVFTIALDLFITYGPQADWSRIIIFQIILAAGIGANMQTLVICVQALVAPGDIAVVTDLEAEEAKRQKSRDLWA